jgi:hypothetical protein
MSFPASEPASAPGVMLVRSRTSYPIDSPSECVEPSDRLPSSTAVHQSSRAPFPLESSAEYVEQTVTSDDAISNDNNESAKVCGLRATVMAVNKQRDLSETEKASRIQKLFLSARSGTSHCPGALTFTQVEAELEPERGNQVCILSGCKLHEKGLDDELEEEDPVSCHVVSGGEFPGVGAPKCKHYERKCWILAACCKRYYPCRRCHDEAEDHCIDRHATEFVGCTACGAADQAMAKICGSCGIEFASYFCGICRFFDDGKGKEIYHCGKCGICRVGKGVGIDNHHCDRCNSCVPLEVAKSHPCIERSLECNCPICSEYLASSVDQVVFMRCGHAMHASCFMKHTATRYTCPICSKSLTDMSAWYRGLDERLAAEKLPVEYAQKRSHIYCHDCEAKTTTGFHFVFHKCQGCGGYNTRVLSHCGGDDDPAGVGDGADAEAPPDTTGRVGGTKSDEDEDDKAPADVSKSDVTDHAESSDKSDRYAENRDGKGPEGGDGASGQAVHVEFAGEVGVTQEQLDASSIAASQQTRKRRWSGNDYRQRPPKAVTHERSSSESSSYSVHS